MRRGIIAAGIEADEMFIALPVGNLDEAKTVPARK
jgi:hypothetical protein